MSVSFPNLSVGEPVHDSGVSVFPLFSDRAAEPRYRLGKDAIADDTAVVTEIDEAGSVPELVVENKSDIPILFLEGEELIGAKQNRVLNTSVLVAARSTVKIPVSCVEQGRWRHTSRRFAASQSYSPSTLRSIIRKSVHASKRAHRGHRSDQQAVWRRIAKLQEEHSVESPTHAMADVFEAVEERITGVKENLQYIEGASGLVVAIGDRIVMMDAFDSLETCRQVWSTIISGIAMDAASEEMQECRVDRKDVEELLSRTQSATWEEREAVGEGREYRGELPDGKLATALVLEDAMIHGSVVSA